jgi:para-aminobenzoate synthetase component 1
VGDALNTLQAFIDKKKSWVFGHLAYDLKNEIEELSSVHFDGIGFPDLYFFEPLIVIRLTNDEMILYADSPEEVFSAIDRSPSVANESLSKLDAAPRIPRGEYLSIIEKLRQHILRGDCYEINFCQEFFAEGAIIDPITIFNRLGEVSPNPFSALYSNNDRWLLCASPERFLKKEGQRILSQPIKGTLKRAAHDPSNEESEQLELYHSSKDRSENVMVVDLVRNDLSRVCEEGSVKVDELFGIYSFPQVHQMISTVSGELREGTAFSDIIRAMFPMGSMTGAPKKRVMELIEQYEKTKRGLFSGAVGYLSPDGDFDFNVVIRSILYNQATKYLSYQVGSGITFYSDPEKEWEECLVKAEAIRKVLGRSE